ncbi:MAG: LysM peptidoglycan-binding domain-containing protein [Solirubrobacterales bacterium]|nr:LysM peptidoglycan-binding domain-containing protein [Solirubrobacterales bacterium]
MSTTPPRNVIYYNDRSNPIPLGGITGLRYTDVILAFLVPDGNHSLLGQGGAFDANGNPKPADIETLQTAGKNVLISLGGSTFPSGAWQQYAQDVNSLVEQVADYVTANGLNGVDIDYEDDKGFRGVYDGVALLIALTTGLAEALPPGQNLITHAPQTPYWDSHYKRAYVEIWQEAGTQITWINNQFYNNARWDGTPDLKVEWYNKIAGITGARQLMVGVPVAATGGDEGYVPLDEMISQVIVPLKANWGADFGGVMGWEFSYDQAGMWAQGIGQALVGGTDAPTPGQEYTVQPGDTLDSIARAAYGATNAHQGVTAMEAGNPGIDPGDLQPGQVISIPVLGEAI